jgi:hypothetical protein
MFAMLLPTTLPTANPGYPLSAASTLTANSGAEESHHQRGDPEGRGQTAGAPHQHFAAADEQDEPHRERGHRQGAHVSSDRVVMNPGPAGGDGLVALPMGR